MNTDAIIPKINIQGSTSNEPLITFIQNYKWNNNNYCLLASNGYTNLNGVIINGDDNFNNIFVNNNNLIFGLNNNTNNTNNNNFIFSINSNEKIRINSSGNLGINNKNPLYNLDINGSINYTSNIYRNNIDLNNIYLNIKNNYWINDNKSNIFVDINSNINNVGIGTSIPLTTLHLGSTNTNKDISIMISKYNDIDNLNLNFKLGYDTNNNNFIIGNYNTTNNIWYKQFYINLNAPSDSLIIDNNGNIGINTNNTNNYKLNINGSLNANSIRGIGSNIVQLDFNNININKPELSNLNNWVFNNTNNIIYTNNNNINVGIGTTDNRTIFPNGSIFPYKLKVNGVINCTALRINDVDTENLYISSQSASNTFYKISDNPWIYSKDSTINFSIYSLNKFSRIIIGDILNIIKENQLCTIYGRLYADNISCDDGSYIKRIDYANIINKPDLLIRTDANNTFHQISDFINYSNSISLNYATNISVDSKIKDVTDSVTNLIATNIDQNLITAIANKLSDINYKINYKNINSNPINYNSNLNTFGFGVLGNNTNLADTTNANNVITVGGNVIATSFIATGNIKENNNNLSDIYISSNVYSNSIINYDKIVDRKLDACTERNYYPPINYYYTYNNNNYSNIINDNYYGNGIYTVTTSTSFRNIEKDNFIEDDYRNGFIQRTYQLFNTNNSSNNLNWQTGTSTIININIGYYTSNLISNTSTYFFNTNNLLFQPSLSNITIYKTFNNDDTYTVYGHWAQYYYSESIILNNIEFYVPSILSAPAKIILIATNNYTFTQNLFTELPVPWNVLLFDYIIKPTDYIPTLNSSISPFYCKISLPTNTTNYKFYRIIIKELQGASFLIINQIKFNGVEIKKEWKHSGTNIYSFSNISINTINNISPYKLNVNGHIYSFSNIYANSNIGIGTTTPLANLHIGSTNTISDGTIMISKYDNIKNVNLKIGYDNNYNFIIGNYTSNINYWNSQFIINSNASSNSLIIDFNGNIGINTNINNNNYKLNINGSTIITNGIINQSNNPSSINSFYNDIYASNNIIVSNIITSNITANYYSTFSNILSCLSNVGIGITNNFNGTLHINTNNNLIGFWNGSSTLTNNSYVSQFIGKNNNNNNGFYITYNHISDLNVNNYLSFTTSNNYPIFNINANCNIGIGITNPNSLFQIGNGGKFTINKTDNNIALFGLNNNDDTTNTKIYLNISNIEYYSSINNGFHRFFTNNNERLRIAFNGNIGIGTTNTSLYKLNINGDSFISSNLYLNSNIGVGTTNPLANIHINNGSFLLNNFRFGNINNNTSNLIIGCSNINNIWIPQLIINSNASSNSLIISSNNYVGINNSNPIGNLHIGDINSQNSTLIISQNQRNFKIGYDNNYNFIFGDFGNTNNNSLNIWNSQFLINSNASANSLIIDNNGNIGINTNVNNNSYKLNINGNILQNGNLNNIFNGNIGIGTFNSENYKLNVNGITNISSQLYSSNIYNSNLLIQNGSVKIGLGLTQFSYTNYDVYIRTPQTCIDGGITFSNSTFQHSGGTVTFNSSSMNINSPTTIKDNLYVTNQIMENNSFLSNTYVRLNDLSNLSVNNLNIKKKYGYIFSMPTDISKIINYNNINYYCYNIDLTKITKTNLIGLNNNTYNRLFNIKCFITEDNFETLNNGLPNILQYDIYMSSNIINNNIKICAIGTPENYLLSNILPTTISLIRCINTNNNTFNYLSLVSPNNNISICYIVEDYLS